MNISRYPGLKQTGTKTKGQVLVEVVKMNNVKNFEDLKFLLILKLILILAFASFLFSLSGCSYGTGSETEKTTAFERTNGPVFENNYSIALEKAAQESKPLLLFFTEESCVFSKKMLSEVFNDPEIVRLSHNFICVNIDINAKENQNLCKELNIPGSPTIQFTSSSGRPFQRIMQYQPKEELARQMEVVLYSVAWKAE